MVSITKLIIGDLPTNCYVLSENNTCILVDSGSEYQADITRIREMFGDRELLAVVCTHNHYDHIMGAYHFDVPCYLHQSDVDALDVALDFSRRLRGVDVVVPEEVRSLSSDMTIGPFSFKVIHTSGHSPGSCSLYLENQKILISGDTLFKGTCGRTDLPGSNHEALKQSLKQLMRLPDDVKVYPGHGKPTTIGDEREWVEDFIN